MEKLANRLLRGESIDVSIANISTLLDEISKLRKVTLKDVLRGFDGVVQQAAERMEKEVAPIIIKGGSDIWIDPQIYQAFLRSLVHVFRNTVAHGIESPEARWEVDKDEIGKITCYVAVVGDSIKLTIADDGAGINLDAVREKVITSGIYTADDVAKLSDDEVAKLIFMDNVSTQKEVTELAGRGVGLAAVLNETKNMGGDIVVKTVSGQGTQFIFTLPLPKEILNEES
jgi:two-component system chemotaxis sensor kinase CheA